MNENTNTPSVETTNADTKVEEKVVKTFTQSDMDSLASKVRAEEKAKRETLINDAVTSAIAEYERKAKLTEEEREKEIRTQREKEISDREKNITMRERKIEALELLAQKGLSKDLVDFVVDLDNEKMLSKVDTLAKTYNKSVESTVQEKLKGQAPKDFSTKKPDINIPKSGVIF